MSILLISPYFSPATGGVETHLDDLCDYFKQKNQKVFVRTYKALSTKSRGETSESRGSVQIHRMWWPDFNLNFKLEGYPLLRFLYVFTGLFFDCFFFLFINAKKVSVIQVHGFIAAVIGVILGKIFQKKVVVNTHVGFKFEGEGLMTKILRLVLLNSDKILVLTKNAKDGLVKIGLKADKIEIYHYWVNQSVFAPQIGAKSQLGWKNKFVVLFVGRLIEVKGLERIFELAKKLPKIQFVIAGSGPLSDLLESKSKTFKNVEFLGKIPNKNLPKYYSGADLLLIPSQVIKQEYEEGIPRVMIEALSCELPVIATPSGGIPDVFDEKFGRLVNDSLEDINKAINFYYQNRRVLKAASKEARRYALNVFSVKNAQIILNSLKD